MSGTGQRRHRVLMLTPVLPVRNGNGAQQRAALFLDALERLAAVDIVLLPVFRPEATPVRLPGRPASTRLMAPLTGIAGDTHFNLLTRLRDEVEMVGAFEAYGRPGLSAPLSAAYENALSDQLAGCSYDLVHVFRAYASAFGLRMATRLARSTGKGPVVTLDVDEDDSGYHRQLARLHAAGGDPLRARWHRAEAAAARKLIAASGPEFDRVWASSMSESTALRRDYGVEARTVANPVAVSVPLRRREPVPKHLLFVGAFDHDANSDGIGWYLSRIHPLIASLGVTVTIIGKNPPPQLVRAGRRPGIRVLGWVEDLEPHYRRAAAAIVPLRLGSGTRIKILESAAHGVPVIATRIGAAGLGLADRRDLWLADRPAEFAAAIMQAVRSPGQARRRAANARVAVMRKHDREGLAARLEREFAGLLRT